MTHAAHDLLDRDIAALLQTAGRTTCGRGRALQTVYHWSVLGEMVGLDHQPDTMSNHRGVCLDRVGLRAYLWDIFIIGLIVVRRTSLMWVAPFLGLGILACVKGEKAG